MKKLILSTLIVLASSSFANDIRSLSQGACWVKGRGEVTQVASFNEGKSYQVTKYHLDDLVKFYAKNGIKFQNVESVETYLHCSGVGAQFVFKVSTDVESYCTWSRFDGEKFQFSSLDLADDFNGVCDGVVKQKLLVAPSGKETAIELEEEISLMGFEVKAFEKLTRDIYSVTLNVNEGEIFKAKKEIEASKSFRFVDLVTRQHPIGDVMALESLSLKK